MGEMLTEESPPAEPPGKVAAPIAAMRSLEEQVRAAGGTVLRYGFFYGPGVPSTDAAVERLRRGRLFLPRGGPGIASWIHIEDAANATTVALDPVADKLDLSPRGARPKPWRGRRGRRRCAWKTATWRSCAPWPATAFCRASSCGGC